MYISNQARNTTRNAISATHLSQEMSMDDYSENIKENNLSNALKSALIQFSNDEVLNRDEALQLYSYFCCNIPNLTCSELTYADYSELVSKEYISLDNIPFEFLTEELCLKACQINWQNIEHVPLRLQNQKMWFTAAMQNPYALEEIPKHYITKELILAMPFLSEMSIFFIPERIRDDAVYMKIFEYSVFAMSTIPKNHPNYDKYLEIMTKHHGVYLEYVDREKMTLELCMQACKRNGCQLMFVPLHLKTFELCKAAVKSQYLALTYLPEHLTRKEIKELYRLACSISFHALAEIPEKYKTDELCFLAAKSKSEINPKHLPKNLSQTTLEKIYKIACQNKRQKVKNFPEPFISQKLCHLSSSNSNFRFADIPKQFWDDEIWHNSKIYSTKIYEDFDYSFFEKYRHLIKFIPKQVQLDLLSKPLSLEEKLDFINFIDKQNHEANLIVNADKLVEKQSPLSPHISNPYIYNLVENAYSTTPLPLRLQELGTRMNNYIFCAALTYSQSLNINELLSAYSHEMVGGRTLAFSISESQRLYLKFKKTNEPLEELHKEKSVYHFINNDTQLKQKLKSQLPTSSSLEKIPVTDVLLAIIKQSEDEIEIIKEGDNHYVYALSFTASLDYSRYAHLADTKNPENPFHKPEQGIKTACYDAGMLASMGIILPSLLPAFHDTSSRRRWVALHSALNSNNPCHPGTFGAWNTTATERPDFGYGGIRDLGDYEIVGEIKTCLQQKDTKEAKTLHPDEVSQRLGFCNAICETLLSAIILRSRLQQQNLGYHYKNQTCLRETKQFIEEVSNQFLSGFFGEESSKSSLQALLHLDNQKYMEWLERAALEIVYWTSPQAGVEQVNAHSSQIQDGYLNHALHDGKLSATLYSDSVTRQERHFFNKEGKLNLGANNNTFPLITLMNGLTLLCTNLLAVN